MTKEEYDIKRAELLANRNDAISRGKNTAFWSQQLNMLETQYKYGAGSKERKKKIYENIREQIPDEEAFKKESKDYKNNLKKRKIAADNGDTKEVERLDEIINYQYDSLGAWRQDEYDKKIKEVPRFDGLKYENTVEGFDQKKKDFKQYTIDMHEYKKKNGNESTLLLPTNVNVKGRLKDGRAFINDKIVSKEEYEEFKGKKIEEQLRDYGTEDQLDHSDKENVLDVDASIYDILPGAKDIFDPSAGSGVTDLITDTALAPPPTEDKKSKKSFVPPITIQHPEDGMFQIGRERDTDVNRKKDIAIKGSKSQGLRLFHDGGFELTTSEDARAAEKGSTIQSVVDGGTLVIKSLGDILIECDGRFSVVANDIRMETMNAMEGDITLTAKHNMTLQSDNYTFIQSESLTLHGAERFIANSNGWMMLIGQNVRIHEPKTKLCPLPLEDYIKQQTKLFK